MTDPANLMETLQKVHGEYALSGDFAADLLRQSQLVYKDCPEDFQVFELQDLQPDEQGQNLAVEIEKNNLAHEEMLAALQKQLKLRLGDIGYAGRKDQCAITRQTISLPRRVEPHLNQLSHPQMKVTTVVPIAGKIRVGQLLGNQFNILLRGPGAAIDDRILQALAAELCQDGFINYFGEQRFSKKSWRDLPYTLQALKQESPVRDRKQRAWRASVVQSALFNCFAFKFAGQFHSGPIYGWRSRAKDPDQLRLENQFLENFGLQYEQFRIFASEGQGARRPLKVIPENLHIHKVEQGIRMEFSLRKGSYATVLIHNFMTRLLRKIG